MKKLILVAGLCVTGAWAQELQYRISTIAGGAPPLTPFSAVNSAIGSPVFQVDIQIPPGVQPGGHVPLVLQVGNNSNVSGAVWIAVSAK